MTKTITTQEIGEYVATHLKTVFETMLSMQATALPDFDPQNLDGERVTGSVGLAGEVATGSVYLHISTAFAAEIAATMLGLPAEELTGHDEVNDVIGEVTNMIGGGLKSWLCDAGAVCRLTAPTVIRGMSFSVTGKPGVEVIHVGFESGANHGLVEIHFKQG